MTVSASPACLTTNKQEFRWAFRKKGGDVFNMCRQLTFVVTLAGMAVTASGAHAMPTGGNVVGGSATITSGGTTTTINQHSSRAIIEWGNFDTAAGETTRFIQPSSSSIALNRVVNSQQATQINGNLTANGRVLVINPNGVLIGSSGHVDVGGFVASSADIDNASFMTATGAMNFNRAGNSGAVVENQGRITIHDSGLGLLVAPSVRNAGVIEGNAARLQMGAGDTFGVDLYGDGLLYLAVGGSHSLKAENTGTIVANAGKVVMTAAAASNVVNSVINTSGVIEARGLVAKGGEVILTGAGADMNVAGTLDVSGKTGGGSIAIGGAHGQGAKTVTVADNAHLNADAGDTGNGGAITLWSETLTTSRGRYSAKGGSTGGNGGFVETSAADTLDIAGTSVDTSAASGDYGLWLLDPTDYTVDSKNVAAINGALSNVSISATGNININSDITISKSGIGLTLAAANDMTMNNQTITLNGGNLALSAGGTFLTNNSNIVTKGGGVDIYAGGALRLGADVATAGGAVYLHSAGSLEINNRTIVTSGGDLKIAAAGGLSVNNTKASTGGGDLTVSGGSVSTNNFDINTTGGSTPATVSVIVGGVSKSFSSVYGSGSHLYITGNAGDVTISGGSVAGNQVCASSGGTQCGTVSSPPAPATVAITVKANDIYKTYGTVDPALTYAVTAGALLSGDSFTGALVRALGSSVGTYAINQGTLAAVTSGSYTYVLTYIPGVFTVNPAFLTITALNQGKTYGNTLTPGVTAFFVDGLVSGDYVSSVALASTGAVATAGVNTYAITASGATGNGLGNYTISYVPGTLTVNPASLTITANNRTKTYGDTLALGTTAFGVDGLKNSDGVTGVTLASAGADGTASVASYGISASSAIGTGLGNYTISYVDGSLTVNPASLTITANNRTKTYGDVLTLGTTAFGVDGLKNSDGVTGVTLASAGADGTASVASYGISASSAIGTGLGNYTISYVDGSLTVNPASLTITANNRTKTYGDTLALGTTAFGVDGLKNSDGVTGVTLASAGADATAIVGDYAVGASSAVGTGLGNYTISYVDGSLTIDPALLTITANNRTKTYGDILALGTTAFGVDGLKNSDNVTDVTLASAGAAGTTGVGSYAVNASSAIGAGLGNYTISYVDGSLAIDPALLTITANNRTKTYGDILALGTTAFGTSGLKNSDGVTGVTLASAGAAGTAGVGSYGVAASSAVGTGLGNYTISYVDGTLSIDPALLTITANDRVKTYGSALALGTADFGVDGLKNSDNVTGVTLASGGAVGTAGVGSYAVGASSAIGAGLGNYTISYVDGSLTVNPAALTVIANNQVKTQGTVFTFAGTEFTVAGTLYNGDTVSSATLASAGAAGTASDLFSPYNIYASNAMGSGLGNYSITYVAGLMTVNPVPYKPEPVFIDMSRPVVSVANNVLVLDSPFEPIETRTLNTDVALLYRGNIPSGNPAAALAALEPAAGGDVSPEALAKLEPAAGGDNSPVKIAQSSNDNIACANDFLNNVPCQSAAHGE